MNRREKPGFWSKDRFVLPLMDRVDLDAKKKASPFALVITRDGDDFVFHLHTSDAAMKTKLGHAYALSGHAPGALFDSVWSDANGLPYKKISRHLLRESTPQTIEGMLTPDKEISNVAFPLKRITSKNCEDIVAFCGGKAGADQAPTGIRRIFSPRTWLTGR